VYPYINHFLSGGVSVGISKGYFKEASYTAAVAKYYAPADEEDSNGGTDAEGIDDETLPSTDDNRRVRSPLPPPPKKSKTAELPETDETKKLTNAQLQRLVLLEQLK
jgi:hypothetical protein